MEGQDARPRGFRARIFESYYRTTGRGAILDDLERAERLHHSPREEQEQALRRDLAGLLAHASGTVPYYRELLSGTTPTEANAHELLRRLPVLTKDIIRREGARLISERPGHRTFWNTSGGSTGEPVRLLQDIEMKRASRTFELLFMRWAGHRWGEPHVLVWGVPADAFGESVPLRERLFRLVHRETYLNCYRITDELLDEWIGRIDTLRPTLIEAYVDAMYELAVRVNKAGRKVHRPRGIITSAGVLTERATEAITQAFGCPILNRYGSREVSNVACSCGTGRGLHVNDPFTYVEVVDDAGEPCPPGVEGTILITLFANRTMPLLRYRIEDRGVWDDGPCPCGRTSRRLASIAGRTNDHLLAADGTRINGVALTTYTALTALMHKANGIRLFQYRQTERGRVTLAVVPVPEADPVALTRALGDAVAGIEPMLRGLKVDVQVESDIAPSGSGKFRFIRNEIKDA
ncbi:MAG TPA: AMP-binding protein [Vicinamibacteria bacterium]|nr:AMP-binding protein [Vicinamibacteria bacterium]